MYKLANDMGKWAFMLGLLVAVVRGFVAIPWAGLILLVLGLVYGFTSVPDKEKNNLIMATLGLWVVVIGAGVLTDGLAGLGQLADWLNNIFSNLLMLAGSAVLAVLLQCYSKMCKA